MEILHAEINEYLRSKRVVPVVYKPMPQLREVRSVVLHQPSRLEKLFAWGFITALLGSVAIAVAYTEYKYEHATFEQKVEMLTAQATKPCYNNSFNELCWDERARAKIAVENLQATATAQAQD